MFMFGHYLVSFSYRDKKWIEGLLQYIFPNGVDKIDLYLASWEGYLTSNLYGDILTELEDYYSQAIKLDPKIYTKRRYFKDLDEALATHLALAFVHFDLFDFEHSLFKEFWNTRNQKRHKEFISFIGRHTITRDNPKEFIRAGGISIEKLQDFWDWALVNCTDRQALTAFGFWVNPDVEIFDIAWLAEHLRKTLEKTDGNLEWEHGFIKTLEKMSKVAPQDTIKIISLYLVTDDGQDKVRFSGFIERELFKVFEVLYKNQNTKQQTYDLINALLPLGNGKYWELKEVIK